MFREISSDWEGWARPQQTGTVEMKATLRSTSVDDRMSDLVQIHVERQQFRIRRTGFWVRLKSRKLLGL